MVDDGVNILEQGFHNDDTLFENNLSIFGWFKGILVAWVPLSLKS
jgi:uncharacterized membrane protein YqaE (UPF0057 family)